MREVLTQTGTLSAAVRTLAAAVACLTLANAGIYPAAAQTGVRHSGSTQTRRSVRDAIDAREAATRALNRRDLKTATSFVDPSFQATEVGGQKLGYRDLITALTQILSLPGVHQDDRITKAQLVHGGAVRLTIHRVDTFRSAQGNQVVQHFVAIETWRKSHGRWKAVREEVSAEK